MGNRIVMVTFDDGKDRLKFYKNFSAAMRNDGNVVDNINFQIIEPFTSLKKRRSLNSYKKERTEWLDVVDGYPKDCFLFVEVDNDDYARSINLCDIFKTSYPQLLHVGQSVPADETWLYDFICADESQANSFYNWLK